MLLLSKFCTDDILTLTLDQLKSSYQIYNSKIFVFNIQNSNELLCTFNVLEFENSARISGTMLIHRKFETNTLYSINALNVLTHNQKQIEVDWKKYENSLLITRNGTLNILPLELRLVYKF